MGDGLQEARGTVHLGGYGSRAIPAVWQGSVDLGKIGRLMVAHGLLSSVEECNGVI